MSKNINEQIRKLKAFKGLDEESIKEIEANSEFFQYEIGQPLSVLKVIPNKIIFISKGSARIFAQYQEKFISIGKITKDDSVGLLSFLRAEGCEEISCIEPIDAISIPDSLFLKLYQGNNSFTKWCDNYYNPSETFSVLNQSNYFNNVEGLDKPDILNLISNEIETLVIENNNSLPTGNRINLISSNNLIDLNIGDHIKNNLVLKCRPPLNIRILSFPENILESILKNNSNNTPSTNKKTPKESTNTNIIKAPIPGLSSIELGQYDNQKKLKLIEAKGDMEETLACFQMLSAEMQLPFRRDAIEKILRDIARKQIKPTTELCGAIASMLGLHATPARLPRIVATRLQTPCLISWKNSFALVKKSNSKEVVIMSPSEGIININNDNLEEYLPEELNVLLVERTNRTPNKKFGLEWFLPSLKKYKSSLFQVLIASFVVQLFGLANPLLIQVVIDKVISQRSLDTLQILGIALIAVTLLEGIISSLRTFLFTETTNRIDIRLGAEVIDHLLRLPLNYFDKRAVGELGSRVAELEKIRNFLTGQALTTILDAAFSIIYIVVMVIYSWLLTLAALFVVPIQVLITLLGVPIIRRQIREVAVENANTQSHLIEVLTGIQTVKAQNVETVSRWKWQDIYNRYITRTFEKTFLGTTLSQISNVLQKLSQLVVLWIGASLVLKGQLTLGQLIAFRIISGYVTQPLLRLTTIWQNVQELRVSFERLSDIIDTPEESSEEDKAKTPLPTIKGNVQFKEVSFTFPSSQTQVLNNIDLNISAGTFVGIVGQSGSGKSTLMKLLPRLYEPNKGKILIDGIDINKVELYSVRRQIGIVPQDPLLFAGNVSSNIALTDPEATSEDIQEAAKIAGAHDFIMSLPNGYSSEVGERGASLSGGQRQRIAIARTIISNPKMIILDEATSALDYDTERRVCENLRKKCKDTTVFFITHRLSTIKNADMIFMLHNGCISESGKHDNLIAKKGRYFALYRQQES